MQFTDQEFSSTVKEAALSVLMPSLEAWRDVRDAADEFASDAELGRRVRVIIRETARRQVDAMITRSTVIDIREGARRLALRSPRPVA